MSIYPSNHLCCLYFVATLCTQVVGTGICVLEVKCFSNSLDSQGMKTKPTVNLLHAVPVLIGKSSTFNSSTASVTCFKFAFFGAPGNSEWQACFCIVSNFSEFQKCILMNWIHIIYLVYNSTIFHCEFSLCVQMPWLYTYYAI